MSRMSDLHIETMNLEHDWGHVIETLINEGNYGEATAYEPPDFSDFDEYQHSLSLPDLTFQKFGEKSKTAVELKIYRWRRDWASHASDALSHLNQLMLSGGFSKGILIVTQDLSQIQNVEASLKLPSNIEIWDFSRLRGIAEGHGQLEEALEDLIAETVLDDERVSPSYEVPLPIKELPSDDGMGRSISNRLRNTEAGNADWQKFEQLCGEAIKCLFGDHIKSWRSQNRTDDELNRMDLIGRIQSSAESFWSVVEHDFRTRYVVFEAKNYKEPIKQGEVYTTEKYLFTKALRSVAIIIARNGHDHGAKKASVGSLREQGKLILFLTMDELCQMLERFDQGDAPENLLYRKMDNLLMEVGR